MRTELGEKEKPARHLTVMPSATPVDMSCGPASGLSTPIRSPSHAKAQWSLSERRSKIGVDYRCGGSAGIAPSLATRGAPAFRFMPDIRHTCMNSARMLGPWQGKYKRPDGTPGRRLACPLRAGHTARTSANHRAGCQACCYPIPARPLPRPLLRSCAIIPNGTVAAAVTPSG